MVGTAGPVRSLRLGGLTVALALVVSLLAFGAGAWTGPTAAERPAPVPRAAEAGRIAYAGTDHRSLGRVRTTTSSETLFGPGPTPFDRYPSARGALTVFTSMRDDVRPQVYLRTGDGAVRKLTTGRNAARPRLSADGTVVVFDALEAGDQRDLWLIRVDGTGERRVTETPFNETSPTLSPDGTEIAYSSDADPALGAPQIYVRDLAGGGHRRVNSGPAGSATEPVWNPVDDPAHRDLIAYTLTEPGQVPRLRLTDGDGRDEPLFAGAAATWHARTADWLPDGDDLVFISPDQTCECTTPFDHVYRARQGSGDTPGLQLDEDRAVTSPTWLGPLTGGSVIVERTSAPVKRAATLQDIRHDGTDPRDLGVEILREDPEADTNTTPGADPLFNPRPGYDPWTERQSYTPDGRRIAVTVFEGEHTGPGRTQRIRLVDADGTQGEWLEPEGHGPGVRDTDPAFSPDGRSLAFTRSTPGTPRVSRILLAEVASGRITGEITPPAGQLTGQDAQPAWSPDGTAIAFTRNHVIGGGGGNKHVWTVPVAALDQQRDLSAAHCPGACEVIDDSPAFSPDGRDIAFNRKDGGGRNNQRNGVVLTPANGDGCRVLLPAAAQGDPEACRKDLPDTTLTGPFQPRDVVWSADGTRLVFSARRGVEPTAPEKLMSLEPASGELTPLTNRMPGRQKEPTVQQSVDLTVSAPADGTPVRVDATGSVTVTVTNNGPAASPGTVFTADIPAALRLEGLTSTAGSCAPGSPQCSLGVIAPGASVRVTARLTGVIVGRWRLGWSANGAVIDPLPGDNAPSTWQRVEDRPPTTAPPTTPPPTTAPPTSPPPTTRPPTPRPPSSRPPTSRPPTVRPPAPPPPALAGPGLTAVAQPNPGFVGGRVVVTYLVRNGSNALATGLRLRLGLPRAIPAEPLPAGCADGVCALPDLVPGDTVVTRVVLRPDKPLTTRIVATLSTTGTDANRRDNVARVPLRILRPRIVAVPPIGKPGFVTLVRGRDFPPGAPVTLTWTPGITAAAAPARPGAGYRFTAQLLILRKDQTGPRVITARGPGFTPVTTPFLVVTGSLQPPDEVDRR
ncbi:hypothetical protein ACFVIM_31910 [Streptomyces sp. NPDC057638]|uniref:hypothetical protein n=1 Tax=Streptomyces sp. NPDC057638 TaxID=3346190 RepID=UPI00367C224B